MVVGMTMDDEYFLTDDESDVRICDSDVWCRVYPDNEYGTGNKTFLFEGMGTCGQPAVCDVVHADNVDDARSVICKKYGERLERRTLVPRTKSLVVEVSDIRK